jgi:hypothetical protein
MLATVRSQPTHENSRATPTVMAHVGVWGGGGGNASGGCSSLRIAVWDALIFYNYFHMAKLCFGLCENSFSFMSSAAGVCTVMGCNLSVLG